MRLGHSDVDAFCDAIVELIEGHAADEAETVGHRLTGEKTGTPASQGLRAALHQLLVRRAEDQPDSMPSDSMPDYSAPTTEIDRKEEGGDGRPLPPRSDPTLAAVVVRSRLGPVERALLQGGETLHAVKRALEAASSKVAQTRPPVTPPKPNDEIWCVHHLIHGMQEPRGAKTGEMCEWCAKFRQACGVRPPRELLEKRARGEYIREADILKALGRRAGRKQRRRVRR